MLADVWQVEGTSGARGEYVSPHARLFMVLEETTPGAIQLALDAADPSAASGRLSYVPPGVKTWSSVEQDASIKHLDLHIDLALLKGRLGAAVDEKTFSAPRLMFDNDRILSLAHLLAEECTGSGRHDLYGESLAMAMFVELFALPRPKLDMRGQLSPRRLRAATQYLDQHCHQTVRLQSLAEVVGLSPSYLVSAFKASTGVTPHQWHMQARVEWVKSRLRERRGSLSEVANAAGFADQAHMTRVFKQVVGLTPAAWMRDSGL